ncbi:biliverdin-producing heme oxygenase [Actinoplanes bogorensis]|uniref:Biliverdin-producing heme oxygenase n=1 Tax=Paractinoplanes bogorensis TaxID=1610840 RepID=A0ABS5YYP3_9ACTN|nr:biliverdin-producing heme oxygenase [Actinoplanes bogorensis]MBU2668570.1 biliverdin-producing heme oxygenase [Actinoplanes bogorensis]
MSLMAVPPGADRLSVRVRRNTVGDHDAAQRSGFLDALAAGRLPWEAYADLTAQHWFIYEALESAATTMADDPVVGTFLFPELRRLPSLEADLRYLYGPRWADHLFALPSTTTYCTRLRHVAHLAATGFVAHQYTRYIGDLSGGQYLGPAIAQSYGLPAADGHRFFLFNGVDPRAFKDHYRALLDSVPWSPHEQEEFITEVAEAYRLNIGVLTELQRRWG